MEQAISGQMLLRGTENKCKYNAVMPVSDYLSTSSIFLGEQNIDKHSILTSKAVSVDSDKLLLRVRVPSSAFK